MTGPSLSRRGFVQAVAASLVTAGCATPASDPISDERLQSASFVLLGEIHDNAEQHRLHAALLTRLLADGRSSCVVFEQMDRGHDTDIAAAGRDAEAVATAGRLDRAGWAWPMHRPVLAAALAAGATVRGGNLGREAARKVVHDGPAAVSPETDALLRVSGWRPDDETRLEHEIDTGHCGALPASIWPRMALAERARDATLAESMLFAARDHDRVVLIAGNGHVRRDLGVPRYLVAVGVPASRVVAIAYAEAPMPGEAYDAVRVTAAAPREDPCVAFLKR